MHIFIFHWWIGVLVISLASTLSFASEENHIDQTFNDEISAPRVNYRYDLGLKWIDQLSRPIKKRGYDREKQLPLDTATTNGERTLGLDQMRLSLEWLLNDQYRSAVTFRPDALVLNEAGIPRRESDNRAGSVYRKSPFVHLLESYELGIQFAQEAELAFGVWREFSKFMGAYKNTLSSAFIVEGAHDLSGLRLATKPIRGGHEITRGGEGVFFELFALNGSDDRGEVLGRGESSFDRAPETKDPYPGLGIKIKWQAREDRLVKFSGLYFEEGHSQQRGKSLISTLDLSQWLPGFKYPFLFNLSLRYRLDKWTHSAIKIEPLYQTSFSLTGKLRTFAQQDLLFGFHLGRSKRHDADEAHTLLHFGHQFEFGWSYHLASSFTLQFLISEEHRENITSNGKIEDGFLDPFDDHSQKMLRRFAFSLSYSVGSGL